MTAGLELDYDVNLDEVIGAGGQGDVFRAERKVDKLQVAIKVTPRTRLRPGPGVCSHLSMFKIKHYIYQLISYCDRVAHSSW